MSEKLKIYMLGSGPIAIPIRQELANSENIELVGVGTQLDRPAGRKRILTPTPLGEATDKTNMVAERIENVNDPNFVNKLKNMNLDMIVVVSFGQILKEDILNLPKFKCMNIHASLLPKYRGASPIVQAICNLDQETGIGFMKMERGLDCGAVYKSLAYKLNYDEYADDLEIKLGELAASEIVNVIIDIANNRISPIEQNENEATLCSKVKKNDGLINWELSANQIEAMCRAYCPWPGAGFILKTKSAEYVATLLKAKVLTTCSGNAGEILQFDKKKFIVACGEGAIEILELAIPGKRNVSNLDFFNGVRGEMPQIIKAL